MQNDNNLFDHAYRERMQQEQPLAARLRPRTLDEFAGQDHILAHGRLLRRAIQADQLSSLIFYGPPGTGKTTLASVIAHTTRSEFTQLNAVLAGVKDVRRVTEEAQRRRRDYDQRTILFVDEVHRWNKAQQDALLPWVENGTVILVGATTENPYFTVNRALVSRSRIFQLKPLDSGSLRRIGEAALKDPVRGYGNLRVRVQPDAFDHLTDVANGDARALLNALELAVETTPPDENGFINISLEVAEESIQRRAVLYDKEGDYHFDTISAFIKSLRGSDPDAAVYWLAKMVHAGEDPGFLFRRMLIFCGEDVGLADPNAMNVVASAAAAFDRVGMPEGRYHLGMAALYLATAPKSNSVFAFFDALAAVEAERDSDVPNHLKDASRDKKGFGHGEGYLYPHAYRDHWVAQQYLPDSLQGKVFYRPGHLGYEQTIAEDVQRRRETQLAALEDGQPAAPPEILTYSPADRSFDRWLRRTVSGQGERLANLRDMVFERVQCARHELVLDLRGDSGLLTWEALRRVPEGGVWTIAGTDRAARALQQQAAACPQLRKPQILRGDPANAAQLLAQAGARDVAFDVVVGRNVLADRADRVQFLAELRQQLRSGARLCIAETIPRYTQRLYDLIDLHRLDEGLAGRLVRAEETIYENPDDPMVNWDEGDLVAWMEKAGLENVRADTHEDICDQPITDELLGRWFATESRTGRPSYAHRLRAELSEQDLVTVEALFRQQLQGTVVKWKMRTSVLTAAHRCRQSG